MSPSKLDIHRAAIAEAFAAGQSGESLGREYGVASSTVRRWLAKNNISQAAPVAVRRPAQQHDGPTREQILEAEVGELRAALRKRTKASVAEERLLQVIERAIENQPIRPLPVPERTPRRNGEAHHRALLMLSDFHGGEVVDREVINGLNEYNWEIMEERVEELLVATESHMKRMPPLSGLDVGFLGDMCSGANHEEIKETNQYGMADQGIKMGEMQAEILGRLANLVPDLRVFAVEGNHPRFEKKPAAKNPQNNMDTVSAMFTKSLTKALPNLSHFEIGRGSLVWEIAGRKAYVFHGDGVRSSMPGVPWGGIMRRANALAASYPFIIDHFLFGHWHQANVVDGGRVIGNGSLKGCDEWTLKNFGGGAPPCQLLLSFDERAQRMTDVRYITPTAGL